MPPLQTFRPSHALKPGDPVRVIAPASSFDRPSFEAGLRVLQQRYQVRYDEGVLAKHRYMAGTDERRLAELTAALSDEETRAIFCARGGYGAMRLLPGIATASLAPKHLVGFSDITALHLFLQRRGLMSIHGPVVTQLGRLPSSAQERLFALLETRQPAEPLRGAETYVKGKTEGTLLGGNLSVLTRLLGTPYMPSLEGAVLLLEDVGERPYRLDRMWTHLELAGVFRQVRGIVLGEFIDCEEKSGAFTSAEILRELATASGLPCLAGLPIGHGTQNEAVALGARVRLDADAQTLTFLEAAAI